MKLGRIAVFGVGYFLGTRAGRDRYDAITAAATRLAERLDEFSRGGPSVERTSHDPETSPGT